MIPLNLCETRWKGLGFDLELSSHLMSTEVVEKDPGSVAQIVVNVSVEVCFCAYFLSLFDDNDDLICSSVVAGVAVAQPDPESMGLAENPLPICS